MQLDELVLNVQEAEQNLKDAKDEYDRKVSEVVAFMAEARLKTTTATVHDDDYKVTVVERETIKFDEDYLFKALGKRRFARVANLKLDRKLLEQAVASGEIESDLVASCAVVSKSAPFLKMTKSTGEPDAE